MHETSGDDARDMHDHEKQCEVGEELVDFLECLIAVFVDEDLYVNFRA